MSSALDITYTPRPDATPESEISTLAAAYRFILDCHAKKKGGVPSTADNAKEIKDEFRADSILPQG